MTYESTANKLRDRIVELIPANPEILEMTDCWALFKINGFTCGDLEPSMSQAAWALSAAKEAYREKGGDEE